MLLEVGSGTGQHGVCFARKHATLKLAVKRQKAHNHAGINHVG